MSAISGEPFTPRTVAAVAMAHCQRVQLTEGRRLIRRVSARVGLVFANAEEYSRVVEKQEFKDWVQESSRYSRAFPASKMVELYTTKEMASNIVLGLSLQEVKVEDFLEKNSIPFAVEITRPAFTESPWF